MGEMVRRDGLERLDLGDVATAERLAPVTPGEVLRAEFMEPLGLSARGVARDIGVPANRVTAILNGVRAITAETALRLEQRFGASAEFWMNLQSAHELERARFGEQGRPVGARRQPEGSREE